MEDFKLDRLLQLLWEISLSTITLLLVTVVVVPLATHGKQEEPHKSLSLKIQVHEGEAAALFIKM